MTFPLPNETDSIEAGELRAAIVPSVDLKLKSF
jgi:hypothetical protein